MKLKDAKKELKRLDNLIKQGKEFEAQGYDCHGMNSVNISIRNKVKREIEVLENEIH